MGEHESSRGTARAVRSAAGRRALLVRGGSLLLLLSVGWAAAGCIEDEGAPIVMSGTLVFTSAVTDGHTHDFSLEAQELSQPPSAGLSRDTGSTAGHTHIVSLTQAELSLIQANQVVIKDTLITDGHVHTFQFSLASPQR